MLYPPLIISFVHCVLPPHTVFHPRGAYYLGMKLLWLYEAAFFGHPESLRLCP